MDNINTKISDYFNQLARDYNPKQDNEHTHRTKLENLLNDVCVLADNNINVRQEIKDESAQSRATPDFTFLDKTSYGLVGLLENKKIGADIDNIHKSEQIIKYRKRHENIIITNYHQWLRLKDGHITHDVSLLTPQEIIAGKQPTTDKVAELQTLLTAFFSTKPLGIGTTKTLAAQLAIRCYDLREFLDKILTTQKKSNEDTPLVNLFDAFQGYVDSNLTEEDFADAFAQTLVYSMLLAKLNHPNTNISLYTIQEFIPPNFNLIRHLAKFLTELNDDIYQRINHRIEEILGIINHADIGEITKELSGVKKLKVDDTFDPRIATDPFIYFYEHFLQEYDSQKRKDRGVYYTPPSVVNFIIRGINHLLKTELNIPEGLASAEQVQILDFATGTGTFLHETILQIFDEPAIKNNSNMQHALVNDHILENFYGFEYLMAPYAIAHLKLSQLLSDKGFNLTETNQNLKIYLTNTLDIPTDDTRAKNFPFTQTLKQESENAHEIKMKPVRVIMGNPPYSGVSQNKGEIDRITKQAYAPSGEKKMNWDDYVKFIRFAHQKMQDIDKGVIGIITNNNFLNAITLRKMRNRLMRDFNKIYILNLHGNSNIGELAQDGKPDKNVFDIRVGVCITFLIKTELKPKKCDVYYASIKSSHQKNKWQQILSGDFNIFKKLDVETFNKNFNQTKWKNRFEENLSLFVPMADDIGKKITQYGNFWGVTDIFREHGSGVKTERDSITIHHNQKDIETVINDFLYYSEAELHDKYQKNFNKTDSRDWSIKRAKADIVKHSGQNLYRDILYRPFDVRKTYYTKTSKGFIGTPGAKIISHMQAGENYGLMTMRQYAYNVPDYCYTFVSSQMVECRIFVSNRGIVSFFPLYLYPKELKEGEMQYKDSIKEKTENFKPEFRQWVNEKYSKTYTPEQILSYIYAMLHSPNFRETYKELLKIDFPRIPFCDDKKQFESLAKLGWQLIQAHLMNQIPATKNHTSLQGNGSNKVEQTPVLTDKNHLYINKSQYFDNMPRDVWEFKIGGYQVLDKYLKERKKENRELTLAELQHIPKITAILQFTITQMKKIDKILTL